LKVEVNGRMDRLRSPHDTIYPQNLAQTSLAAAATRSVKFAYGLKATEFLFFILSYDTLQSYRWVPNV
jgi:hypothetical protein